MASLLRLRAASAASAAVLFCGTGLALATAVPAATPAGAVTCTINGTAGNDVINVTTFGAVVCAGAGDDTVTIASSAFAVQVFGGDGNDQITDNGAVASVSGEAGDDTVTIAASGASVSGGDGNDHITDQFGGATLDGDAGNDTIDASAATHAGDVLDGGADVDTLTGSPQNDVVRGGTGADKLAGGGGNDTLDYSDHTSAVVVNLTTGANTDGDTTTANPATPLTGVAGGFQNVLTGSGNDALVGDTQDNVLDGGMGSDTFDGVSGNDTVSYASHTGKVTASLVTTHGGQGSEFDTFSNIDNLTGGSAGDTLTGDDNPNVLNGGSSGTNTLIGGGGNDTLIGGTASDTLDGGSGDDTMDGGAGGNDTVVYSGRPAGALGGAVSVTLNASAATTGNGEHDVVNGVTTNENDTISNVENLTGGDENDTFTGSTAQNTFDPGFGDDTIVGGGAVDEMSYANDGRTLPVTATLNASATTTDNGQAGENDSLTGIARLTGGNEDDTFTGSSVANHIDGGGGNNTLSGGAGNDSLVAGTGSDYFFGGAGTDSVDYGGRQAVITASIDDASIPESTNPIGGTTCDDGQSGEHDCIGSGIETINGGAKDDFLYGNGLDNTLAGGGGFDTLHGEGGNDQLSGGGNLYGDDGDDTLVSANNTADYLDGGAGNDTVSYAGRTTGVTVDLRGGPEPDGDTFAPLSIENITGTSGDDVLIGDSGPNTIKGAAGNDLLVGNEGNDTLDAGSGADVIFGDTDPSTGNIGTDTCTNAQFVGEFMVDCNP